MDSSSSETEQLEVSGESVMQIVRSGYEGKRNSSGSESFSASFPMGLEAFHAMSWTSKWRDHEERREIMSSCSSNTISNMDWGAVVPDNCSFVSPRTSNMSDGLLSVHSVTDNHVSESFLVLSSFLDSICIKLDEFSFNLNPL